MKAILRFAVTIPVLLLFCCSSNDKNSDTPEGAFAIAQEFEKDERYDEATRRYQEVKNKFPYSHFATKAELAIADVHFKDEAYPEAQVSYQSFKELHPKHAQIDYVVFRIGMSFFKQLPDSIDRDLTLANDAITSFDELIREYPRSEYVKEATEKKSEALKKLAEKEDYIGDFYYKREMYQAALARYEDLIKKYPGQGYDAKAWARAAISAHKSSQSEKAKDYIKQLRQKFPNSPELEEARKVVE